MRKMLAPLLSASLVLGSTFVIAGCGPAQIEPQPPPVAAKPAPPPKPTRPKLINFTVDAAGLKLPGPVVFETGSDKLKPESDEVLEVVQDYLDAKPEITMLRIEGHTDNDGAAAANQTLSEKRAMAVARWLTSRGVKCDRLVPVGFGQTKPIAGAIDKQTPDEKAQNRRVAFVNAAIKGKAIGGLPVEGMGGHISGDPCK